MDPKESKSNTMAHFGGADKDVVVIDQEVPGYQLGKCGRWLSSIPPEHERAMRQTREYREFLAAFERLEHAHGKVNEIGSSFSFIQYMAADDIILRIFEFLESQSLVACQRTCSRLLEMANKSASRRVRDVGSERQLSNVMMLLRAKEQLEGVAISATGTHVRIPTLLLSRRVQVTNAGDPELNGIYHCTGSNGNGFVFTKPRQPVQRVERRSMRSSHEEAVLDLSRDESEVAQPGKMLRCLIAKRFSNEVSGQYLGAFFLVGWLSCFDYLWDLTNKNT